jgi:hypothetical protein
LIARINREIKKTKFLPTKINDSMKKYTNEPNGAFSKEEVQIA